MSIRNHMQRRTAVQCARAMREQHGNGAIAYVEIWLSDARDRNEQRYCERVILELHRLQRAEAAA